MLNTIQGSPSKIRQYWLWQNMPWDELGRYRVPATTSLKLRRAAI